MSTVDYAPQYLPVQCRFLDENIHHVEQELLGVLQRPEGVDHAAAELARGTVATTTASLGVGEEEVDELGGESKGHQLWQGEELEEREREGGGERD